MKNLCTFFFGEVEALGDHIGLNKSLELNVVFEIKRPVTLFIVIYSWLFMYNNIFHLEIRPLFSTKIHRLHYLNVYFPLLFLQLLNSLNLFTFFSYHLLSLEYDCSFLFIYAVHFHKTLIYLLNRVILFLLYLINLI